MHSKYSFIVSYVIILLIIDSSGTIISFNSGNSKQTPAGASCRKNKKNASFSIQKKGQNPLIPPCITVSGIGPLCKQNI